MVEYVLFDTVINKVNRREQLYTKVIKNIILLQNIISYVGINVMLML